jgi:hypothetical protein
VVRSNGEAMQPCNCCLFEFLKVIDPVQAEGPQPSQEEMCVMELVASLVGWFVVGECCKDYNERYKLHINYTVAHCYNKQYQLHINYTVAYCYNKQYELHINYTVAHFPFPLFSI